MRKHPLAQMLLIGAVASVIGVAIALSIDWFPPLAADRVGQIDTLYDVLLIVSVPIFVLVMTVAIYSVVKFRAKPGDTGDGAPIHGNTRLEVVWVTIPFIMVTALAAYGWVVLHNVEAKQPGEMLVKVRGQQFTWHFQYKGPNGKPVNSDVLYLAKDKPVKFDITTEDVIHSFWVPTFRLKQDAVPGMTTHVRVTPNKVGTYEVVCAELCGLGHATMRDTVRVVQPAAFTAWLQKQSKATQQTSAPGGAAPGGGTAQGGGTAAGKQVFASNGCASCHTLADAGATGTVGPKLDDLAAMAAKYGKQLKETPTQYVTQSIEDPKAFTVPGFPNVMPTTFKKDIPPAQIKALVQYLLSVSGGKAGSG